MKLNQILSKMVDSYVGICGRLIEVPLQCQEASLHFCASHWQDTSYISPHSRKIVGLPRGRDQQSAGAGHTREVALWSTLGETAERYAATVIDTSRLICSTYNRIEGVAVHPSKFILFSVSQYNSQEFPFQKFDEDIEVYWTPAIEYPSCKEVFVPAEFVWSGAPTARNSSLDNGYSTGLAAGPDAREASFSAIREVVERDAYMCYFLTRTPPPPLSLKAAQGVLPIETSRLLERDDIEFSFLDVTTDINVPCVLTHMWAKHDNSKGIASGLCAHPNAARALEKSIIECFHTFNWLIDLNRWENVSDSDVVQFMDHVRYYIGPNKTKKLAFMFDSEEQSDLLNNETWENESTTNLINNLDKRGYKTYLVDITPCDIRELGISVVRAVIPGLQPIYAGYGNLHKDCRRLDKFMNWKGLTEGWCLNDILHPFP